MTFFVDPAGVAGQSVAEATGAATTAGVLAGSAPAMVSVVPMGSEEVSALLATAIQAHNAQFWPRQRRTWVIGLCSLRVSVFPESCTQQTRPSISLAAALRPCRSSTGAFHPISMQSG